MHSDICWTFFKKRKSGSKLLMKTQSCKNKSGKQREVWYYFGIIVYLLQIEYNSLDITKIFNRWSSLAF